MVTIIRADTCEIQEKYVYRLMKTHVPEEQFINSPLFRTVGANGGDKDKKTPRSRASDYLIFY